MPKSPKPEPSSQKTTSIYFPYSSDLFMIHIFQIHPFRSIIRVLGKKVWLFHALRLKLYQVQQRKKWNIAKKMSWSSPLYVERVDVSDFLLHLHWKSRATADDEDESLLFAMTTGSFPAGNRWTCAAAHKPSELFHCWKFTLKTHRTEHFILGIVGHG